MGYLLEQVQIGTIPAIFHLRIEGLDKQLRTDWFDENA